MAKVAKAAKSAGERNALHLRQEDGESNSKALARTMLDPGFRHGYTASTFIAPLIATLPEQPELNDYADRMQWAGDKAVAGDLASASRMLAAQAITLDTMFAEFARRAAANMSDYLGATESYSRMAFKAQANSRAAIEALAKLHQPREQTVRHVHVNEGGQAVIADQFHTHTGGAENAKSIEQPLAPGPGPIDAGPALPSPDPLGQAVPVPGDQGQEPVPNARGQRQRRT
jgi:hypothetical protein